MEGLRIELGGEALDPLGLDPQPSRGKDLPDDEVLKISLCHFMSSCVTGRPIRAPSPMHRCFLRCWLTSRRADAVHSCGRNAQRASRSSARLARQGAGGGEDLIGQLRVVDGAGKDERAHHG